MLFCGTYSAATGVLALCLGLMQLIGFLLTSTTHEQKDLLKKVLIWACVSSITLAYHFTHYRYEHYGPRWDFGHSSYETIHTLIKLVQVFCAGLANPLSIEAYNALSCGILVLITAIWLGIVFWRADRATKSLAITPIILFAYGVATEMLIVIGRGAAGFDAVLSSRYCTFLSIGIAGLYMLLLTLRNVKVGWPAIRLGIFIGIIFIASITSTKYGLAQGAEIRNERLLLANMTRHFDLQPESAFTLQRNSTRLASIVGPIYNLKLDSSLFPPMIELCKYMKENHLSLFWNSSPSLSGLTQTKERPLYMLESINWEPCHMYPLQRHVIADSNNIDFLFFKGYALDFKYKRPSQAVFVSIDGKWDVPTAMGLAEPEVASKFHRDNYQYCGFAGTCRSLLPGKGIHTVTLKIISPDQQHYSQSGPLATLEIR